MSNPTTHAVPPGLAPTRLRQIALVVEDLEKARRELTHVIGTEVIYEDPGVEQFGLRNFIVPLGGDFIEVVAPIRSGTTAGRLLEKRGDGGYMIIMQTSDAASRRSYIETQSPALAKVIWGYEKAEEGVVCVQYHPKGIAGSVIPELDSHAPTEREAEPMERRFSHWHALGPDNPSLYNSMTRTAHLSLEECVLRLAPSNTTTEDAAKQWENLFGVASVNDNLSFTNARMKFIRGEEGEAEGLVSVTIGVKGRERFDGILERASKAGLCGDGWINMCGVKWYFVLSGDGGEGVAKL